jgi:hypothetical protein
MTRASSERGAGEPDSDTGTGTGTGTGCSALLERTTIEKGKGTKVCIALTSRRQHACMLAIAMPFGPSLSAGDLFLLSAEPRRVIFFQVWHQSGIWDASPSYVSVRGPADDTGCVTQHLLCPYTYLDV